MANNLTGDLYTPEMMEGMREAMDGFMGRGKTDPDVRPKEVVDVTSEQYAEMEGMTKAERIKYLGKKACPCGSRKRRNMCCGVNDGAFIREQEIRERVKILESINSLPEGKE